MGGLEIACASGEGSVRMGGLLLQGVWGSLLALEGGTARGPGANMHGSGRITELQTLS